MKPIEALTENDFEMMDTWIENCLDSYSGYNSKLYIKSILREWSEQKERLFAKFGEKLILDKVIEVPRSQDELHRMLNDSVAIQQLNYYLNRFIRYTFSNYDLMIENDEFLTNSLINERSFVDHSGKKHVFNKGCKTMKYISKLIESFSENDYIITAKQYLEEARLEQSRILNGKNTKVRLCLSIHPMDYMTMSDTPYNWDSCMSWANEGCYRMGTVEMMNSPCVIVAYIRGKKTLDVGGKYEWNGKRWRELFVVEPNGYDVISEVKAYPYRNTAYTQAVLDWLAELTKQQKPVEYIQTSIKSRLDTNDFSFYPRTHLMYNDFNNTDYYTAKIGLPVRNQYTFTYSGKAQCMHCGSFSCSDENSLLCDECNDSSDRAWCACCGCRIDLDNEDYFYDENSGDYYCCDCRDEHFTWDEVNEEYIDNDDAIEVFVAGSRNNVDVFKDRSFWTNRYNVEICNWDEELEPNKCDNIVRKSEDGDYYCNLDEVTVRMLRVYFWNANDIKKYARSGYEGLKAANPRWHWTNDEPKEILIA